jgi:clan AA aspartic protease
MNGRVDDAGRALIPLTVKATSQGSSSEIEAWIDTGFTGESVLPQDVIATLQLPQSGTVTAQLADGSIMKMTTYTCIIHWFGGEREIEVIANDGRFPLLGIGLLRDHSLSVDYPGQLVTLL